MSSSNESESKNENESGSQPAPAVSSSVPKSHFKSQDDQDIIRLALHKSPFFTCLDEEQIERFVRTVRKESFPPGSIVILEGCVDDDEESCSDEDTQKDTTRSEEPTDMILPQITTSQDSDVSISHTSGVVKEDGRVDKTVEVNGDNTSALPSTNGSDNDESNTLGDDEIQSDETLIEPPSLLDQEGAGVVNGGKDPSGRIKEGATRETTDLSNPTPSSVTRDDPATSAQYVPAPRSGKVRSLYIIRRGKADVWYEQKQTNGGRWNTNSRPQYIQPHAMGPGTLFGEGGFLFGRQHSASVIASRGVEDALECWVIDLPTFRDYVLLSDNMKNIFRQFASVDGGQQGNDDVNNVYMTLDDFMKSCEHEKVESSDLLTSPFPTSEAAQADPWARARVANTLQLLKPSRTESYHRISLTDFCWFYFLLSRPDPEVDIAFLLMDQRQSGHVGLAQVAALVETVFPDTDYESDFFRRYFGQDGQHSLRPTHFSQFFADLHQELGRQVFVRASKPANGYLKPVDFVEVLRSALGWRLPLSVADRLDSLYCRNPFEAGEAAARVSMLSGSLHQETTAATVERAKVSVLAEMEQNENGYGDRIFTYPDFLAFQEVITNLPGICNLIDRAQEIKKGPLSPDDFKVANRVLGMGGKLSRRQVDIVFALFDLDKDGYISHQDTISVCGKDFARRLIAVEGRNGKLTFAPPPEYRPPTSSHDALAPSRKMSRSEKIAQTLEYFGVTVITGALGTVVLYPVDLIKTRLMNQRLEINGTRMYKGFFDCFRRTFAKEGFFSLYRGLTPQLLGLGPEKLIKLQVNDLLRKALGSKDKETGKPVISLPLETMAGAISGACQLLVTNPMELTKIRMQMHGETSRILAERGWATTQPRTFVEVVKDLGFPGIYRAAQPCLLRDIFFGALYFPTYAWCKEQLASKNEIPGYTTPFDLLTAGTLAGVPAALFTTPFDVIKTRLQTLPRPGEIVYRDMLDCAKMMYKQEGLTGFFVGSGARVFRIAPQFGLTLLSYEWLTESTGSHRRVLTPAPPTNVFVEPYDYRTAFPVRSIHTKTTEISNFMQTFSQGQGKPRQESREEGKK
eukprot:scaffold3234_cov166-Amphora_coffeaeformis.AAC.5